MAIAYDARPATRDVDAIWKPSTEIRAAATRVAARHDDLDEAWLNDGVKAFLPGSGHHQRVVELVRRHFPNRPIEAKVQFYLEELLASRATERGLRGRGQS
ncbi:hypothetical protein [Actinopolymorpha alba]|uniref:hypothetical protein n=1 Tax=Actinopolymorpha alba TaxID=533267 RepID=UPI00192BEDFD|nr:hypothetical protein [Actinopolymorpha alba]